MSEREKTLAHTDVPEILRHEVEVDREGKPLESALAVRKLSVDFAIETWLTQRDLQNLDVFIQAICKRPENTPKGGTHWAAGCGSKPIWNEPDEPTFDTSEYNIQTCARDLSPEEIERRRKRAEAKQ